MNNQSRSIQMLSLCKKAGKLSYGAFQVESAVKSYKACAVVIAKDASVGTKKEFSNMCIHREIPYLIYGDKESLGRAIGKEVTAVLAICDEGFAEKIITLIKEDNNFGFNS